LGVVFGLALFLFSSVAFEHGYDSRGNGMSYNPASYGQVYRHNDRDFRNNHFRNANIRIIIRINVRVLVVRGHHVRYY
jgi:hypothetical protein